jgi:hypothetical protein
MQLAKETKVSPQLLATGEGEMIAEKEADSPSASREDRLRVLMGIPLIEGDVHGIASESEAKKVLPNSKLAGNPQVDQFPGGIAVEVPFRV